MMRFAAAAFGLLAASVNALPAPEETEVDGTRTVLPPSCYLKLQTSECFSYTTTVPPATGCTTYSCPPPNPTIMCPMYIKVETTEVPCADDCCPVTPTATATGECYTCPDPDVCHIPTETITVTTGCGTTTIELPTYTWPGITTRTEVPTDLPVIPSGPKDTGGPIYTLPTVGPVMH